MINLIVLTKNYPRTGSPQVGIFVEEQVREIRTKVDGPVTVICPVPWSPKFLWVRKKWKEYGRAERQREEYGIKIYFPRYLAFPGRWLFPLQGILIYLSVRSLVRRIVGGKGERIVLHSHTILPDGLAGSFLKKELRIPHVCTVHGSDINLYPSDNALNYALTKYVLKNCDHIVTVSERLREKVLQISENLKSISVIYNGANGQRFRAISKAVARRRLGVQDKPSIILFVGNLVPVKGVNLLIRAFSEVLRQNRNDSDVLLYLVGDGNQRNSLVALAERLRVIEKVIFVGRRPHDEIPYWLNAADVLVLSSLSEGFPTIIPEAMMCGIPVIASNVGGVAEIVYDKITGILTQAGSADDLEAAMKLILSDEVLRRRIVANARDRVMAYTWEDNASRHAQLYESLLTSSN